MSWPVIKYIFKPYWKYGFLTELLIILITKALIKYINILVNFIFLKTGSDFEKSTYRLFNLYMHLIYNVYSLLGID